MYHGLKFNALGVCTEIPGQDTIPPSARVPTYPAVERDSWIWIWMGDPQKADPGLITPAVALNHPDWCMKSGYMHYAAGYELICDNLLDFSHVSFVHANTFGGTEAWARLRPQMENVPRGLRIRNILKNVPPAKFLEGQVTTHNDI
jgi:vanillate O-demethylase monooxygenase subunit